VTTRWTVTIDCAHPARLAAFWRLALGYVAASPPEGSQNRTVNGRPGEGVVIITQARDLRQDWVELRGFEPLTPSMRTRCATGLRHSPRDRTPA
jgi:hypothetical protein